MGDQNFNPNDIVSLKKGFVRRTYVMSDSNAVDNTTCSAGVSLAPDQVTNTSIDGESIISTRGVDDFLYVTIRNNETQYKIVISAIPSPDGATIPINNNEFLHVIKDPDETISVAICETKHCVTIKFDPTDFLMSTDYSYNLINGQNTLKDYKEYTINVEDNSIMFCFSNSDWPLYEPSITSPLIVQFYSNTVTFPFQIGGVPPNVGLMKVFNITQITAKMTWTSDIPTTTQIEYGITTDYGTLSTLKIDYTILHQVILRGLEPNTMYHYRVKVKDSTNIEYISDDYTFTTLI